MKKSQPHDISVLYVEDDSFTREEVSKFIGRRVQRLWTAGDGREGLILFETYQPDLVITDILMPKMDGLTMSMEIMAQSPQTRIIATTAHSESSYILRAMESGIHHYLLKPIDMNHLSKLLERIGSDIVAQKELKKHHEENERLVIELRKALDEINVLRGILPMCSYCKNIRNDEGYWEQVESYISNRTEAWFSHSICPDCMQVHHPEVAQKAEK